jgi:Ca2+:H+ antiporter
MSVTRFAHNNNKMELAIAASIGSSIQMIILAVQRLIFSAQLLGVKMNLLFTPVEMMAIALTIVAIGN